MRYQDGENDRTAHPREVAEIKMTQVDVLLIEDNPRDAELAIEFLKEAHLPFRVIVASDGEKAMSFLGNLKGTSEEHRPSLILLDIKLPKKDGFEILSEMRNNRELASIPVVILTGSKQESDKKRAMGLGADLYCLKPRDVKEWNTFTDSIGQFWIRRTMNRDKPVDDSQSDK
jgi:two-component system response regulator